MFVEAVPEDEAAGEVAAIYEEARAQYGYVPNLVRPFSLRPEVWRAWLQLNGAVKAHDLRRYELATLAAARRVRSSYCALAHGRVLAERFFAEEEVPRLPDGLDEADRAVMELAEKVVDDATSVSRGDVDRLRSLGLTDEEIVDVVLAAAVRCFFSKTLDALGVQPDAAYAELDPAFRDPLTVGRPIEEART
ncbi:MAG: peroxidase [Actinobacteria bacterium]|nr:peroxidase [Actinomycetota bacterium]